MNEAVYQLIVQAVHNARGETYTDADIPEHAAKVTKHLVAELAALGEGGVAVERLRALHEDWRIRSEGHLAAVSDDRPRIIELRRCMAAIGRLLTQPSAMDSEENER